MSADMLASQFDILEEPQDVLTIDIIKTPQEIITIIRKGLNPWNLRPTFILIN